MLELVEHAAIKFRFFDFALEYAKPEFRNHEELLNECIHVAGAPEVFESHISRGRTHANLIVKVLKLDHLLAPLNLLMKLVELLQQLNVVALLILAKGKQESESLLAG